MIDLTPEFQVTDRYTCWDLRLRSKDVGSEVFKGNLSIN